MTGKPRELVLGEHLFRIAREAGFRSAKAILDEAANATIVKKRVNPATFAVGDVLVIPEVEPKKLDRPAGQVVKLTVADGNLLLNLTLLNQDLKPLAKRAFRLVVGQRNPTGPKPELFPPIDDVTGGKGELTAEIGPFVGEGELTLRATDDPASAVVARVRLLIGILEPASSIRGQQARLNNLGYFAGFTDKDLDQLRWAIEEFQFDHGIKPSGRFDDPITFNKIAHVHGDLLASERVP